MICTGASLESDEQSLGMRLHAIFYSLRCVEGYVEKNDAESWGTY